MKHEQSGLELLAFAIMLPTSHENLRVHHITQLDLITNIRISLRMLVLLLHLRSGERAGECQHLHACVPLECRKRNNAVLDCICGSRAHEDGTEHFKDSAEDHGLTVGD